MELEFNCPSCGKDFNVEYDGAGGKADCPHCGAPLEFGNEPAAAPARRAPAKFHHPPSHANTHLAHKSIPKPQAVKPSGSMVELAMWLLIVVIGGGSVWWWLKNRSQTPESPTPTTAAPQVVTPAPTPPPRAQPQLPPPTPVQAAAPAEVSPAVAPIQAVVPEKSPEATVKLSNPGFETALESWNITRTAGLIRAMTDAAHSGNRGLHVTDGSTEHGTVVSHSFTATSSGKYECRFWARVVSGDGVNVSLRFQNTDGQGGESSVTIPSDTKEWKEFTVRATAPSQATTGEIWIQTTNEGKVVADFDDFSLREVE